MYEYYVAYVYNLDGLPDDPNRYGSTTVLWNTKIEKSDEVVDLTNWLRNKLARLSGSPQVSVVVLNFIFLREVEKE